MKKIFILTFAALAALAVNAENYEVRTLTFEDADSKGQVNVNTGETTWSSLIDAEQYNGPILYDSEGEAMWWYDENNTELWGGGNEYFMEYWTGGYAISNYHNADYSGADYLRQLEIPVVETNNFCVVYNYRSNPANAMDMTAATPLEFSDGEAHVVESLDLVCTNYFLNVCKNGNDFCSPLADDDKVWVVIEGLDEDGEAESSVQITIGQKDNFITEWTKIDLTDLGEVYGINIYVSGTESLSGTYGFNPPGYVAIDNIAVRFPTTPTAVEEINTTANAQVEAYFTLDGKQLSAPAKGINLVRKADGSVSKVLVK